MNPSLPRRWSWSTLGSLSEKPQYGFTTKAATTGSVRFLRTTDITHGPIRWDTVPFCAEPPEDIDRYRVRRGDILISRAGSVGYNTLVREDPPEDTVFASYLIRFRLRDPDHADYVALFLMSPGYWAVISAQSVGIALSNVNAKKLAAIPVPMPPRGKHKHVVSTVEDLFTGLDAGQADLKGALSGASQLQLAYVEKAAAATGRLVDLESLLKAPLINGRSVPSADTGFPVLRLTALRDGTVDTSQAKVGDWDEEQARPYLISAGDFLVARGNGSLGLVGRGGLVGTAPPAVAFPDTLIRVRVDESQIHREFLALIWDSFAVRRQIESQARTTAGIYKINQSILRKVRIPLPDFAEQPSLIDTCRRGLASARSVQGCLQDQLAQADAMRASILHRAFSGELRSPQHRPDLPTESHETPDPGASQ